jgi:hypothetical protein
MTRETETSLANSEKKAPDRRLVLRLRIREVVGGALISLAIGVLYKLYADGRSIQAFLEVLLVLLIVSIVQIYSFTRLSIRIRDYYYNNYRKVAKTGEEYLSLVHDDGSYLVNIPKRTIRFWFYVGVVAIFISVAVWLKSLISGDIYLQIVSSGIMFFASVLCVFSLLSGDALAEGIDADAN